MRKFPRKYMQVAGKKNSRQHILYFIDLDNRLLERRIDVTQLASIWPKGGNPASTCVQLDMLQSERKSSRVIASAHKAWPIEVASSRLAKS